MTVYLLLSGILTICSFFSCYTWVSESSTRLCNLSKFILLEWGRAMRQSQNKYSINKSVILLPSCHLPYRPYHLNEE